MPTAPWVRPTAAVPGPAPASFTDLVAAGVAPEKIADNLKLAEGPLWLPDGHVIVSEVNANAVLAFDATGQRSTFLQPSGYANGHTFDAQGRIIQAEHSGRLTRIEADGQITLLADKFEAKRLNSPNDVAVKSDGAIYFTDPDFGLGKRTSEIGFNGVYRFDAATSKLTLLTRDIDKPNGIVFSLDERTLYISDSTSGRIHAYSMKADGTLGEGKDFGPGNDGLALDVHGNVWSANGPAVTVIKPDGTVLGDIAFPEPVTNLAWGSADGNILFVTTYTQFYKVQTLTTEAMSPGNNP